MLGFIFSVVGLFFKYGNVIFVESIKAFTKNKRIVIYYKDLT